MNKHVKPKQKTISTDRPLFEVITKICQTKRHSKIEQLRIWAEHDASSLGIDIPWRKSE